MQNTITGMRLGDRVLETWCQHEGQQYAYYRVDHPDWRSACDGADIDRWHPSIHMPRWACRLLLDVVAVRVERLHAITEADAKAEGAPPFFALHPGISREQRLTSGELASDAEHRSGFEDFWRVLAGLDSAGFSVECGD